MGFSVTALSLVNRVNRRRRMPDVTAFSATEDLATLDALNTATEEVLSSKRWEFDIRRAQITLRPRLQAATGETMTVNATKGAASATLIRSGADYFEAADVYGSGDDLYVTRFLATGASSFPNTAFRVIEGLPATTLAALSVATPMPETLSGVSAELFYAEYMLPDTVRSVLRVTHQDDPVTLEQVDPTVEFEELYPRPQIEYGTPQVISIGGYDTPTVVAASDAPDPALRMMVWPVPDDAYVLDYTYHYRHAELAATTDTLQGVPPNVIDMIVDLAAISMKAFYDDADSRSIARYRAIAMDSVENMHQRHGGMFAERKRIGNWDGSARGQGSDSRVSRGRLFGGS